MGNRNSVAPKAVNVTTETRVKHSKVNAPTQNVINYVEKILNVCDFPPEIVLEGRNVINALEETAASTSTSVNGILHITHQVEREIETDTKEWLTHEIIRGAVSTRRLSHSALPTADKDKRKDELVDGMPIDKDLIAVSADDLAGLNFSIFSYQLVTLATRVLMDHDIFQKLLLSEAVWMNFITEIEQFYGNNPYHSQLHAADVLQTCHCILKSTNLDSILSKYEVFSLLIAAVIHDYQHLGLTNQFLINTRSDLARIYNDRSVLENHHVASAFAIMNRSAKYNILLSFAPEQRNAVRANIISLVLSTDMSHHFQHIAKLNETLQDPEQLDLDCNEREERRFILELALKMADISNPIKQPEVYKKWTERLFEEFYAQGAREKQAGLEISAFMDAENPAVEKCQIGFIDFVVQPLLSSLIQLLKKSKQLNVKTLQTAEKQLMYNRNSL